MSINSGVINICVQDGFWGFIVRFRSGAESLLAKSIQEEREKQALERFQVYERYEIETHHAPPRKKQPRPFTPRISKVGLASMLLREVFEQNFKLKRREYRRVLLSRPCIYGVFSGRFGGFHPIREKCVGCMRCVQEFPGICTVDRNPEFYKSGDSYWVPDDPSTSSGSPVATILLEAEMGKIPVRGMGYKGAFAGEGWDSMWTDMSEIVRPTRDGVYGREYISTLVDVGRKQKYLDFSNHETDFSSRTVETSLPIIFDHLPPNLNNQYVLGSIAGAAKRTRTMFIAAPDQAQRFIDKESKEFIPLISPERLPENLDCIHRARLIELERYDAVAVEKIRRINATAPVLVRLPLSKESGQISLNLARADVDGIHLVADYHGKGADVGQSNSAKDLIRSVHRTLVEESLRDEITLIASGGITLAEHVPKAIICGADLVGIDTTILVALQMQFDGECRFPEAGRIIQEKFDAKWGEQRLVNLLGSWHDQLIEILSAMGMRDVRRLRGDVGRAMFNEDLEKEAFANIIHGT